jgi:hypothetical protein
MLPSSPSLMLYKLSMNSFICSSKNNKEMSSVLVMPKMYSYIYESFIEMYAACRGNELKSSSNKLVKGIEKAYVAIDGNIST